MSVKILDPSAPNQPYNLFLDDERQIHKVNWKPIPTDLPWRVARCYEHFIKIIELFGLPEFISFDHDLADEHYALGAPSRYREFDYSKCTEKTGMCCAKWLVEYCLDNKLPLPRWQTHSLNPCGCDNINGLLNSFKNSR